MIDKHNELNQNNVLKKESDIEVKKGKAKIISILFTVLKICTAIAACFILIFSIFFNRNTDDATKSICEAQNASDGSEVKQKDEDYYLNYDFNSNSKVKATVAKDDSVPVLGEYLSRYFLDLLANDEYITSGNPDDFKSDSFSICDIDLDGENELLIYLDHGCSHYISLYNIDNVGMVKMENCFNSGVVFYQNGYVYDPLSHNQGKGTMHPYELYRYDSSDDVYSFVADVDSWNKEFMTIDKYTGELYPDEIDRSSTGTVYYLYTKSYNNKNSDYIEKTEESREYFNKYKYYYDYKDFVKWYAAWNQNSPIIEVPYESMTIENIQKYNPDFNYQPPEIHYLLGYGLVNTNTDPLNLRAEPNTNCSVLDQIPQRIRIPIYSCKTPGWYFTNYNDKKGYVSAEYIILT